MQDPSVSTRARESVPTLAIEIRDPRPDCHVRLYCDTLDVSLAVSTSSFIVGVLPTWDELATKIWEDNERLELDEVPGTDPAVVAELGDALVKAAAPFMPMIRQAVMGYLGMVQDEYREAVAEQARKPVPVLVQR